jgi:hypothetical protein
MIKRPVAALVSSAEMLGQRIHGMQRIDAVVSRLVHSLGKASGSRRDANSDRAILAIDGAMRDRAQTEPNRNRSSRGKNLNEPGLTPSGRAGLNGDAPTVVIEDARGDGVGTACKPQERTDRDLSGDMLKLVRYKILFMKRGYEIAFPEQEELVADNTNATAYAAWKIAEFTQRLGDTEVPAKWGKDKDGRPKYPGEAKQIEPTGQKIWVINRLPEDDKKYLRVFFEVLDRYPRAKFKFEKRQIKLLEQIRDRLA